MTKSLKSILNNAVSQNMAPYLVAMTGNSGGVTFCDAVGYTVSGQAATKDTVFCLYSMTKSVCGVAAMIMIERGKFSLETPVGDLLPEWNDLRVLEGFDGDTPVLRRPRTTATIRNLVTHTSGMEYELWNADVAKYLEVTGNPAIGSGLRKSLQYPLVTDPGTRYGYGPNIDWLGCVIEEVDGRSIDVFCREEIFDPLGMTHSVFELDDACADFGGIFKRAEDGTLLAVTDFKPVSKPEFYPMGHAMYGTAPDYMRLLRMILNKGQLDGNRVLSELSVKTLVKDHMQGLPKRSMRSSSPLVPDLVFEGNIGGSFVGKVMLDGVPGKFSPGTLVGGGLCNTYYWIDPVKDVASIIMTQVLPYLDDQVVQVYDMYEAGVYASLGQ